MLYVLCVGQRVRECLKMEEIGTEDKSFIRKVIEPLNLFTFSGLSKTYRYIAKVHTYICIQVYS